MMWSIKANSIEAYREVNPIIASHTIIFQRIIIRLKIIG